MGEIDLQNQFEQYNEKYVKRKNSQTATREYMLSSGFLRNPTNLNNLSEYYRSENRRYPLTFGRYLFKNITRIYLKLS